MGRKNRLRNVAYTFSILLTIALTAIVVWEALPRADRYTSVHPMSTVPPLMGFSADSVVNTGTADQLDAFPGIGEVLAGRIIEGRETFGPYRLPEDLLLIKGIGTKKVAGIVDALTEPLVALPPSGE